MVYDSSMSKRHMTLLTVVAVGAVFSVGLRAGFRLDHPPSTRVSTGTVDKHFVFANLAESSSHYASTNSKYLFTTTATIKNQYSEPIKIEDVFLRRVGAGTKLSLIRVIGKGADHPIETWGNSPRTPNRWINESASGLKLLPGHVYYFMVRISVPISQEYGGIDGLRITLVSGRIRERLTSDVIEIKCSGNGSFVDQSSCRDLTDSLHATHFGRWTSV